MTTFAAITAMQSAPWLVMWLGCPGAFSLICWLMALHPERVLALLPDPGKWWLLGSVPRADRLSLKELVPKTTRQAFELGRLVEELRGLPEDVEEEEKDDDDDVQELLKRAQLLLDSSSMLTRENLLIDLPEAVVQADNISSRLSRLIGAFSVVNLAGLLAIVGICISIGPTMYQVAQPLVEFLVANFFDVVVPILMKLWRVLEPLYEPIVWSLMLYIVAAAARFPSTEGANRQIAILGAALAPLAFSLSTTIHVPETTSTSPATFTVIVSTWALSYLSPLAVAYESQLMGFMAVAACYSALGFGVAPIAGGFVVGWDSQDQLVNSALASMWTLTGFFAIQSSGLDSKWIKPFKSGASVFGGIVLGLAGLIWSSGLDPVRNGVFFGGAVLTTFYGAYLKATGLQNTGITFFVLWAIEKCWELSFDSVGPYPLILGTSVALYQATLFLRTRPDILASFFDIFVEQDRFRIDVDKESE
eukprot:CAMPEP_0197845808 /NCGR_PEP_ID=MMETSP1438-20131217/2680_1 /TAXON_ID=1461541 /ORGANISM="Pterosperma sp., Strain CCMP1384" /LENGTH=475 /DNA_ID=CAMNT_0043457237 /DNA_START=515 /DNA_END=1942 /DNA_ORIENTATION=-